MKRIPMRRPARRTVTGALQAAIPRRRTMVLLAIVLVGVGVLTQPGFAQEGRPVLTPAQTRAAEAAMSQLRSPYTASHTVDMCPSAPALRDSIRVAAASGMTTGEMVEDVISRHGEHLRVLPKRSGPGLFAWLATPLLLIIGGGLIYARLRREGAGGPPPPEPEVVDRITDAEREQLAAAMRSFEETGGIEP